MERPSDHGELRARSRPSCRRRAFGWLRGYRAEDRGGPVERVFDAFVDGSLRGLWLPGDELRERTATKPKSARFDWADGETRVNVTFLEKGDGNSTVAVEHARLADAGEAERLKAFWRERLTALKSQLAGGEIDA